MKKTFFLPIVMLFILLGSSTQTFAQQTSIYNNPEADYRLAVELFEKEKYSAAQDLFFNILKDLDENSILKANAEYYSAMCAIELFNNNAEYLFTELLKDHPENSKVKGANFELANFEFRKKKYRKALQYYDKVDIYDLNQEQKSEYFFKTGYSYLKTSEIKKATKAFFEIKDNDSRYYAPANYYYGHLQYADGNYETALQSLRKIENDETFEPIIPYYVIQLYYLQGKFDELLELAPKLLKSASDKRKPEIAHIAGEAMIRSGRYKDAIPYLEFFEENNQKSLTRDDNYQMGFTYFMAEEHEKSLLFFEKVIYKNDSIAQNTYYHMADCFLKTNNKKAARSAFLSAYKLPYDKKISEDALFNYAKLSYELSYNPYNEAIKALQEYIKEFPESERLDDANNYLVNLFLTTKNYKNALTYIENIKKQNEEYKAAYQKISYFRGLELFNNYEYSEAIELLKKSQKYNYDKDLLSKSYYWIAETYYRQKDYKNAIKYYKDFQLSTASYGLDIYDLANYNVGYAYFKTKKYNEALVNYRKFLSKSTGQPVNIIKDAYLRSGDCNFIMKSYDRAIEYYDKAMLIQGPENDYALYQKGLAMGVLSRFNEKASTLKKLITDHAKSPYVDDAIYEIAMTYLIIDDNDNAMTYFNKIKNDYPKSRYVKKSILKTGLIYYNTDQNEKALNTFMDLVKNYPATVESKEALVNIRNIYVDMNKVEDFFAYTKDLPFANISYSSQDSITYIAAENKYLEGNCKSSVPGFINYIEKFPDGEFIIPANFYKAECDFREGRNEDALVGYMFVVNKANSKFTESAVSKAAEITFTSGKYAEALDLFIKLEEIANRNDHIIIAKNGKMKCLYILKNYESAIKASRDILSTKKVSNDLINQAHFTTARSAYALDKIALAQAEFDITSKLTKGIIGAEAKYYLALIQYEIGNYTKADKIIFEFIDEFSGYDYWLAKNFILLADIYTKTGDLFQAKQTLQSIIDNYEGAELVKIAYEKQNAILEMEKTEQLKQETIEMDNDTILREDGF
ncbi:MAG: tetratricopeptide repeat protein [Bacteroidales bacterium]|nr:tetratricopeptide repeat protein [Bacteroidales bacterium]